MGLIRFGDHIELLSQKCNIPNLSADDISGINRDKEFFEPSRQVGEDTSNYKYVPPGYFACNLMHVGRDVVLPIALNTTEKTKVVSPAYTIFKLKTEDALLSKFLFMHLKSDEKDRFFWFHCDSSVRDGMDWNAFCDIELDLPPIEIQRKYVAIYEGLLANLHSYESKLEELKLVCDGYIEDLRKKYPLQEIKNYIKLISRINDNPLLDIDDVLGVSNEKTIVPTKSNVSISDLPKFTVVKFNDFIYNPRNGVAIGLNKNKEDKLISFNNTSFIVESNNILPDYLFIFFCRHEWDRKVRFDSWGSSTEVYSFEALSTTKIPIPPLEIQNSIVEVFNVYNERKEYVNRLKIIIKDICPLLVRGAIKEASEVK